MFHLANYQSFRPEDYILFACIMIIFVVLLILLVENCIEYRHAHEQAHTATKTEHNSEVDETDD